MRVKDIKGYEGLYQITDQGDVISLPKKRYNAGKNNKPQFYEQRVLKKETTKKGYLRVMLANFGKYKKYYVHRLVAIAFLDNPKNKPQVNHKNLNKTDNSVDNLEWVTNKENYQHYVILNK